MTQSGPLAGLRVVELTDGAAGAMTGELLALLGAEVLKVEPPNGDRDRFEAADRVSARFVLANLGKRSLVADLHDPAGNLFVVDLVCGADVVIHNRQRADLERLNLTYERLAQRSPGLIHVSITGFGEGSPFAALPVTEAVLQSLSGIASITGEPDEPPQRVGPDAAIQATALYATLGILAAVIQRARTGHGQRVEVSMLDAAINLCRTHYSRGAESGRPELRPGNRQPSAQAEPTGVFPAAGGGPNDFVFAHASPEHLWRRLLKVIGREDALDDPRFVDGPTRLQHRDEVHALVDEWTTRYSSLEILNNWGKAGIAVGATLTTEDLVRDETLVDDGQFADVDQHDWGVLRVPVLPFTFTDAVLPVPSGAPRLGEATPSEFLDGAARTGPPSGSPAPNSPALAGIRVLDFTQALAGPTTTQALALLGAEVVRVQRPDAPSLGVERPWLKLNQLSMNKRSVLLDIKSEDGYATVRQLVQGSDVVMENFAPGTLERLGLGWDVLSELNPQVVLGRIKGFAPHSPYRENLAFDNVAEAMGTACSLTGEPDGPPMLPGPHLGDIGTGLSAAVGVLALLVQRLRTGRGAAVTASMQGTVATVFSRFAFASQLREGSAPLRSGFAEPGNQSAPEDVYRCAGGGMNDYCYISASTDVEWRALAGAIGRSDLLDDERYRTSASRWSHRRALREEIESWTSRFDKQSAAGELRAAGITAAPVLDTAEVMNDPYLQRRHVFVPVEHPDRGHTPHVFWPVRMSDSSVPLTPAPIPGADTEAVLATARS